MTTFNVTYTIPVFSGQPSVVTDVLPTSVTVTPAATPGEPAVQADPASGPAAIRVTGGAVAMNITITDGRSVNLYYPVGLAVQENNASKRPTAVFPPAVASGTTIALSDNNSDPGLSYEFVVLFQAANGDFGSMDPRITNDG